MTAAVIGSRAYNRVAIDIMTLAYDKTFEQLSEGSKQRPNARTNLTLCILKYFDEGTTDPILLSRMALAINTFSDRKCVSQGATAVSGIIRAPIIADRPIAF